MTSHLKCLKLILFSTLIVCVSWWAPTDRFARKRIKEGLEGTLTVLAAASSIAGAVLIVQNAPYRGMKFFPLESARPDLLQSHCRPWRPAAIVGILAADPECACVQ